MKRILGIEKMLFSDIEKSNIEDIIALSPMQEGMLFHYLQESDSALYFEQLSLTIAGAIDIILFEKAWNIVIKANEMLRTVFRWVGVKNPIQIILKNSTLKIEYFDFSDKSSRESEKLLEKIRIEDRGKKFDLRDVPFRITLCRIEADRHEIIISNHHILYDGWSNGIILKEFFSAYNHLSEQKVFVIQKENKYRNFVSYVQSLDPQKQEKFWGKYLGGFDAAAGFFFKKRNKTKNIGVFDSYQAAFLPGDLAAFGKKHKVTLACLLYCAWGILLQKCEYSKDVIFGTTVAGRSARIRGIEEIVGLFINTLPLRVTVREDENILDLLYRINSDLQQREEFEHTPLVDIKRYCKIKNNEMLFDSILAIENYPLEKHLDHGSDRLSVISHTVSEISHYDLTLRISVLDSIESTFIYNKESFDNHDIESLFYFFKTILNELINDPYRDIRRIEILSSREKHRVLYEFNDTRKEYPGNKTIHWVFQEQVKKTPDIVALNFDDKSLSYRELNKKSARLALILTGKDVKPDSIIGIMMGKSIEMIIGIMSILKAGGAYMPIDPGYPGNRIDYMLADSNTGILLTTYACTLSVNFTGDVVYVDNLRAPGTNGCFEGGSIDSSGSFGSTPAAGKNQTLTIGSKNLAYVMYTSGSTGTAKGVMVEHRNVVRLVKNNEYVALNQAERLLQTSAFEFDASTFEIWGSLLNGLTLYLVSKEDVINPSNLKNIINKDIIDTIWLTSSLFNRLSQEDIEIFSVLKNVLVGGDSLSPTHIDRVRVRFPRLNIINGYGPTENTTFSTTFPIDREYKHNIPIGRPIANSTVFIVDYWGNLLPVGFPGELVVGGDGAARGYLKLVELTDEKFMDNPFRRGDRVYKTGDLGRWLPDGNIQFLGRKDKQVKIRGYRVELGEIETSLLKIDCIKEAGVIDKQDESGDKYLCAYVAADRAPGGAPYPLDIAAIRNRLAADLPGYMIPAYFEQLEKIPLTANGKLDRENLPAPQVNLKEYVPPGTDIEIILQELFSRVLDIRKEKIGIDADFFELGGHSLKATSLLAKIHKVLEVKISLVDMFAGPTIREIASLVGKSKKEEHTAVMTVESKAYYMLSSAQERLYVLWEMAPTDVVYNMTQFIWLQGEVDKGRLEQVFRKLIARHESLRTSFHIIHGKPVQRIHPSSRITYEIECLRPEAAEGIQELADDNAGGPSGPLWLVEKAAGRFVRPFDLSGTPLFRIGLMTCDGKQVVLVDMHHIISDGVSQRVFEEEFAALSNEENLPALRIQYKDYVEWQNNPGQTGRIKEAEAYWLNRLAGELPVLNLPLDYPRPALKSFEGNRIGFILNARETGMIRSISNNTNTTLYMVMLAIYDILLAKLTGAEDIIVGTPTAGRRHSDLERMIGMFVNTLVIRSRPVGAKSVDFFLNELREATLGAYENHEYPFEYLVDRLAARRDAARNPIFDVVFNHLNQVDFGLDRLQRIENDEYIHRKAKAMFDLTLTAVDFGHGIYCNLEYCTALFKARTIDRFITYFRKIIAEISPNLKKKIAAVEIISYEEKNLLLYKFNDSGSDYPNDKTVHELFKNQVEKTPAYIAVEHADKKLTYKELDKRSDRSADLLIKKGIKADTVAAVMCDRSLEMLIVIFGILKAAGAYLPIDREYPASRINYILAESNTCLLIAQEKYLNGFFDSSKDKSQPIELFSVESVLNLKVKRTYSTGNSKSSDLAYIIYTSGTGGKPKGVMIDHRSLANYVCWAAATYAPGKRIHFPLFTSISFDLTVTSIFVPLITGQTIIVYEQSDNLLLIEKVIKENNSDIMKLTPSHLKLIRDMGISSQVKRFIVGGENFEAKLAADIDRFSAGCAILFNEYGPTETAVGCMIHKFDPREGNNEAVPIGLPIHNMQVYILDDSLNPTPTGSIGEIYISGDGVARGYVNAPELTHDKFIKNPFVPGQRMYKSGDLARYNALLEVEFIGRKDNQVKIRGYRIELEEIANKLRNYINTNKIQVEPAESLTGKLVHKKECKKCLLPENFPGISFDREGVCNICRNYERFASRLNDYFKKKEDFKKLVEAAGRTNESQYDCLLLFSGGKDSSYVLYNLVEMGLRVLTFTFDNGYISQAAFDNIKRITTSLNVAHIIKRSNRMNEVFTASLHSDFSVCHGCWHTLNLIALQAAAEYGINMIISGLSRGQIYEMRLEELFKIGIFDHDEIEENLLLFREKFFSKHNKFARILDIDLKEEELEKVYFVDFFSYDDTSVRQIKDFLIDKGWTQPEDTGFCSSNCIINDVGIYMYIKEKGYHFYVNQLSWDVRLGSISREEGYRELQFEGDIEKMNRILSEIGYYQGRRIRDAVVIDKKNKDGDTYLCAYIVFDSRPGQRIPPVKRETPQSDFSGIREYLLQTLPDYMTPAYFIEIDKIPLTPNGKLDRDALPDYYVKPDPIYEQPASDMERLISDIWKEVLGIDYISVHDNFFQIGGNSLYGVRVIHRLKEVLKREIPVVTLFRFFTVQSLARYFEQAGESEICRPPSSPGRVGEAKERMKTAINRMKKEGNAPFQKQVT